MNRRQGLKPLSGFGHDANGNMTRDYNKNITHIQYNTLNLPQQIDLPTTQGGSIKYTYDAGGRKLRTNLYGSKYKVTDYIAGYVYEDTKLQFILTPEGRITYDVPTGSYKYEYFLKDHLGDTRVTFDQTGTVLQTNAYDPFGYTIAELSATTFAQGEGNKYLYNGKELQDEFDLDWSDYGARFYDATSDRFWTLDPKAEKFPWQSPFCYAANNPIRFIDKNGEEAGDPPFGQIFTPEQNAKFSSLLNTGANKVGNSISSFINDGIPVWSISANITVGPQVGWEATLGPISVGASGGISTEIASGSIEQTGSDNGPTTYEYDLIGKNDKVKQSSFLSMNIGFLGASSSTTNVSDTNSSNNLTASTNNNDL